MARIEPLSLSQLPESMRQKLESAETLMGFLPNDALIMARWPELLSAVQGLVQVIYRPGELDARLKRMIATVVSAASGCRYCQAHTAHGAVKMAGVDEAKIAAVWDFKTSPLFTAAERCALELALAAGQTPNAATDAHFDALRQHYSEREIIEIVAMIALFGFLNRWNATLDTPLENAPREFAQRVLPPTHWPAC